ncbi:MAG: IPExxxVDY family protein [Chitinophagales bacterium]|nr:IPExxxVDY family protein [Bacteroidota bacterium]
MATKFSIEVELDFQIWGINSNMEDYRLCWHLNHYLGWQLKRVNDVELKHRATKELWRFNAYKYNNELDMYMLELIQNKKIGNVLIPELKNIDFLFLLSGEEEYFGEKEFTDLLTKIPGVQSTIRLELNSLKSRHNLLYRHFNEHS